jgi:hypothetical protein
MQDNTTVSISNIIDYCKIKNFGGRGIADGQQFLVAAVETGCISTGVANDLSAKHALGLHWDSFWETVSKFVSEDESRVRKLAIHFHVSESAIKSWATGASVPYTNMCNLVVDYINRNT